MPTLDAASARHRAAGKAAVARPWWGQFELEEGEAGLWELGPLALSVERLAHEWRLAWCRDPARDVSVANVRVPAAEATLPEAAEVARFAVHATSPSLAVEPILPDRDVVAKPESGLHVLAGEEVTVYIPIPVSLRLLIEGGRVLTEVPTEELRETWRGRTTTSGELCWVAPEPARLRRGDVEDRAHHAIVAVTLHNRADAVLLVERVSVTVSHLSIWHHPQIGLLAADVRIERDAQGGTARLEIGDGPPAEGAALVRSGRQPEPKLALVRALEALLD